MRYKDGRRSICVSSQPTRQLGGDGKMSCSHLRRFSTVLHAR